MSIISFSRPGPRQLLESRLHDLIHHPAFTSRLDEGTPRRAADRILATVEADYIIRNLEKRGDQVTSRNEGCSQRRSCYPIVTCKWRGAGYRWESPNQPETAMLRAALVFVAILLLAADRPTSKGPEVKDATLNQLWDVPQKYHGKLVRIEGVVASTREHPRRDDKDPVRYSIELKDDYSVYIICDGKPAVGKGNQVRITGLFLFKENSFVRRRLTVRGPHSKVEKLPTKK